MFLSKKFKSDKCIVFINSIFFYTITPYSVFSYACSLWPGKRAFLFICGSPFDSLHLYSNAMVVHKAGVKFTVT